MTYAKYAYAMDMNTDRTQTLKTDTHTIRHVQTVTNNTPTQGLTHREREIYTLTQTKSHTDTGLAKPFQF